MIKSILFGKWGGGWGIPHYKRPFYRFKALVCSLLNLEPEYVRPYTYAHVVITYTDGGKSWSEYGTNYWYECIIVGSGFFSNWWCAYDQGSSD